MNTHFLAHWTPFGCEIKKMKFWNFYTNKNTNYMNILYEGFLAYLLNVMLALECLS